MRHTRAVKHTNRIKKNKKIVYKSGASECDILQRDTHIAGRHEFSAITQVHLNTAISNQTNMCMDAYNKH